MPAWITSELRELVWVPMASSASRITTSRPARASSRATARPTMPAPITIASTRSTGKPPFEDPGADARKRGDARHRPGGAVEKLAEERAQDRGEGEADRADQGGGGARRVRKRRERERGRARQDERGTEEKHGERHHQRSPMAGAGPGETRQDEAAEDDEERAAAEQAGRA